jgi:hypothetical protein
MLYGLLRVAVLCISRAGSQVKYLERFMVYPFEPETQCLSKERMVAIPASLAVERDEKQIGALQLFEYLLAPTLLEYCIT